MLSVESMKIQLYCTLKEMKEFIVESTCKDFIPKKFMDNDKIFIERRMENSLIYVEADKKIDLQYSDEIVFVEVDNVMGIMYNSKSGNSRLKWRQVSGELGKLTGEASMNSIVNLYSANIKGIEPVKEEGAIEG